MREETKNWWIQAQNDLESARKNLEVEVYYVCAFLSQQAVEKGMKALCIHKNRKLPRKTHNLLHLAKEVDFPQQKLGLLRAINPDFVTTRYPDAANGIPTELFDREIAQDHLSKAEEVMNWIDTILRS
ncbi:MAG: HEPN domain-containing protein [bacterium]